MLHLWLLKAIRSRRSPLYKQVRGAQRQLGKRILWGHHGLGFVVVEASNLFGSLRREHLTCLLGLVFTGTLFLIANKDLLRYATLFVEDLRGHKATGHAPDDANLSRLLVAHNGYMCVLIVVLGGHLCCLDLVLVSFFAFDLLNIVANECVSC